MKILVKNFIYYILAMIVFVSLKLFLNQIFNDYFNSKFAKQQFQAFTWTILPLFININLVTPIIEEFGFRYPILENKVKVYAGTLVFFIIFPLFGESDLGSRNHLIMLSLGIIYYTFLHFLQFKNPILTVYFSAFIFGSAHLVNFENLTMETLLPCWFNVIPQMISGVLLAKLRISKGLHFSIYFHMIINLFVTFLQIYRN